MRTEKEIKRDRREGKIFVKNKWDLGDSLVLVVIIGIVSGGVFWFSNNQNDFIDDEVSAYLCDTVSKVTWNSEDFVLIGGTPLYESCIDAEESYVDRVIGFPLKDNPDTVNVCSSTNPPCNCYSGICEIEQTSRTNAEQRIENSIEIYGSNVFNERVI